MTKKTPLKTEAAPEKVMPEHIWANIFRAGKHTSRNGVKLEMTTADLAEIAAQYDASNDPAPMVVGHPKHNSPAYGWVDKLRLKGDFLQAKFKDVQPAFVEAVRSGAYKQISVSLRDPNAQRQRLRHVGFLGGAAPAIPGLGTVDWSEGDTASQEFCSESLSEFSTTEDNVMNDNDLKVQAEELAKREAAVTQKEADFAERQAAARLKDEAGFAERQATLEQRVFDAEYASFESALHGRGVVNPLGSELTKAILQVVDDSNAQFSEGAQQVSLAQAIKDKMLSLPKTVDFSEISKDGNAGGAADFSEGDVMTAAREIQSKNPHINWPDAVAQASKKLKGSQ